MLELLSEQPCFRGVQRFYRHESSSVKGFMRFGAYLPPQASLRKVPVLFFLAGLTCNEETFAIKAGAQRYAAEHGIAIITPDTSPRGDSVADEPGAWDVGIGAGFYIDATLEPWSRHYRMYSYVLHELPDVIATHLPVNTSRMGVSGHSMGGHGALVLGLRNRHVFRSMSALAPIAAPSQCQWGKKAFGHYLGPSQETWSQYDASELLLNLNRRLDFPLLVDQGLNDPFLLEQLNPDALAMACAISGQPLELRRRTGYDHGYYFVSTFIGDHIAFHSRCLR
ncbi:S-formylglutathione hydrolase FrmB [Paraburkholderia ultramafica]|uniref:S-formylglutathione hydrolase n=1 Tax=Paraburkholderia ultramafica TaxID=1544867 RepID=A0A6S7CXU5_9BURK|nr:S-formylglutathione hydrolase [Paraburkholderia ultramafica]CAB3800531.1 S-formylglutathione hydrolase FrmB [Paraburkholderia ultramafica]